MKPAHAEVPRTSFKLATTARRSSPILRCLSKEIMNAVMDALAAHKSMSEQAIASERVREGIKGVLLGPAKLYEALRMLHHE
jgi:hypothetical protein